MASYNSKFITGDKLKPIIQDVYAEINKTSTNASIEITNALNTAKTYAENKSTEALNSAKSYADNVGSTTLSSAKSYADNVGSSTLTAAKKYTDDEVSAALDTSTEYTNDEVAKSLASAKEYADGVGTSTLNSAKAYTDNVGSTTLSSAKSYADNVGSTTLSSANSYTDTSIENLVDNAPTDANTLKKLNDRINTNVQSISDLSNVVDTKATDADLTAHKNDKSNPHSVTKAQVGLGNADNTADAVKDVRSATKLATTHSIFGQDFDGTADVSGQATVDGIYQSDNTKRYLRSAIQIRENGLVGNSQSDIGYGPAIGFNWVGHNGGTLVMGTNGTFYLKTKDWTRATLDANIVGNLTGNITGDVTGDITGDIKGNVTGNLTGTATNATNDSLGQKIDTTYIKGLSVSGRVITYTRGDDTIGTITTQDTTYPVFTGATSSTAGTTGLVPAPGSGDNLKFLRADGNWIVPTDTNTWRPVEDVLDSTSTVNSLTANQGRVLRELIESKATEAKNYTDTSCNTTLGSAKTYADGVGSDTLASAKSYADDVGAATLKSAKEYSDSNVNTLLGGASTDSNTLKKLNDKIVSLTNSSASNADLTAHINDKDNPHKVTKAQVDLGNVDNTADADKNVLSATKLTTARSIFGQTFNGTANVAGRATIYGEYVSSIGTRYAKGGLVVRENDLVGNTQSDIGYSPTIGFLWNGVAAGSLLLNSNEVFYLKKQDCTSRATLDANIVGNVIGNITGNVTGDVTGNITGNITGNAGTATTLATARNIQVNLTSTSAASFDGSTNVTPGVTGVLGIANGGTGKTTGVDAANYFLNSLSTGSNNPTLSDYYIAQYAGGGTTSTTYHRRPISALWNTFNVEAAKVYLPLAGGTITGDLTVNSNAKLNTLISADGTYKIKYAKLFSNDDLGITQTTSNSEVAKALLKALCATYPGLSGSTFEGKVSPNSIGYYKVYIYSTSEVDSNGLPRYSFGEFYKYCEDGVNFGTSDYTYYFRKNITSHQDISGKQDKSTAVTHTANTAVGSATQPIYVASSGAATVSTANIGSADVPIYMSGGTITASTKKFSDYLPLSGGTMSGTIQSSIVTDNHLAGNQGRAIINSTAAAGSYTMLAKMNSTNGYFTIGAYGTGFNLYYTAKTTVTAGTNAVTHTATLLNENGHSTFPGTVTATKFSGPLSGNATSADKATKDSADQTITSTYIKALSISGRTITYTKGNGTTGTITTQDTTYSAATSSAAGLMPAADKAKLDSIGDIITITKTLTITTEWQDTGISGTDLYTGAGSYIIQVIGMNSDATNTYHEIWTGFMSWYTAGTNSGDTDEIVLHKAGHGSNYNTIYLRTVRTIGTVDNPYLRLQICASTDFSSTSVTFKFRKLI